MDRPTEEPTPVQGAPDPEYEDVMAQTGRRKPWLQLSLDAFLGITSLLLALNDDFARGRVEFSGEAWRVVLAAIGAVYTFLVVRWIVRMLQGHQMKFDRRLHRRAKRIGVVLMFLGIGLLAIATIPPLGDRSIDLGPVWLRIGYALAGAENLILGLLFQWNPTKHIQVERVRSGEGIKGRARIIRASDTGVLINEAPQVLIDFEIEVEGQPPFATSDRIVMQQAKLALLIPGSTVGVTIDRINPKVFHVDWDDWRAPAPGTGHATEGRRTAPP